MSRTLRTALTILAVAIACVSAANPADLPTWVAIAIAGISTGLASVGITPPQLKDNERGQVSIVTLLIIIIIVVLILAVTRGYW